MRRVDIRIQADSQNHKKDLYSQTRSSKSGIGYLGKRHGDVFSIDPKGRQDGVCPLFKGWVHWSSHWILSVQAADKGPCCLVLGSWHSGKEWWFSELESPAAGSAGLLALETHLEGNKTEAQLLSLVIQGGDLGTWPDLNQTQEKFHLPCDDSKHKDSSSTRACCGAEICSYGLRSFIWSSLRAYKDKDL